jgi:predicted acetyltransferase
VLVDPERDRGGHAALRCVLLDDARGYAVFSTKSSWDDRGPAGEVKVRELVAVDGPARLRLVEHLLGIDLVSTWSLRGLSLDDALLGAVVDSRRLAPQLHDALHVRLVRVGEALAGRTYAAELDVVLDVDDARLPDNARRWRLSAGPHGATCAPTDAPPDLALGVEDLGAAYLGGTTLVSLAASGRVRELRAGALTAASRAFRGDVEPLCTHVF